MVNCMFATGDGGGGGGGGGAEGVTEFEAPEGRLQPVAFCASTVKVKAVPAVRGDTVHEVAGGVAVHWAPPGFAVTR